MHTKSDLDENHSSVILDDDTPKQDNVPVFSEVWKYMLGECISTNVLEEKLPSELNLFPNPASHKLHIQSKLKISMIEIIHLDGTMQNKMFPNQYDYELETVSLNGLVIFRITTFEGIIHHK